MVQVTEKASSWAPYRYDPDVIKRADPNKRRRWLIPLVLLAQIAFKARHCPLLSEEQLCSETLCICRTGFFLSLHAVMRMAISVGDVLLLQCSIWPSYRPACSPSIAGLKPVGFVG